MLARWLEILSQFHFTVEYRPGTLHKVPDALSRRPPNQTDQSCQTESESERCFSLRSDDWSTSYLRSEQDKDPDIAEVAKFLSAGVKPKRKDLPDSCHKYLSQWARLRLIGGVLFRLYRRRPFDSDQFQVVLPKSLISGALTSLHAGPTGGHFASDKLLAQARLRFWWPRCLLTSSSFVNHVASVESGTDPSLPREPLWVSCLSQRPWMWLLSTFCLDCL